MNDSTGVTPDLNPDDITVEDDVIQLGTLGEEMQAYKQMREEFDQLDAIHKQKKKELREKTEFLFDYMEAEQEKTKTYDDGSRLTRVARKQLIIPDKEAAVRSLDELGMLDAFIRKDFAKGDLSKFVRELVEQGKDIPEGLDLMMVKQITYTKAKG